MIDISKLKELVELMSANDLTEVGLRDEKQGVRIRRASPNAPHVVTHHAVAAPAAPAAGGAAPAAQAPAAPAMPAIESPMVGTCYLAPNPDAAPFVKVGQAVSPDTVVCLIEAMKVFNEIKAEKAGVIEQVLVKNGQAVEFGQRMFSVRV